MTSFTARATASQGPDFTVDKFTVVMLMIDLTFIDQPVMSNNLRCSIMRSTSSHG